MCFLDCCRASETSISNTTPLGEKWQKSPLYGQMRKLASRALATWRVSIEKEERDEDGRDVDGDTMKLTARQVPADDEAVSVQIFVCQETDELRVCRARLVRANNLQQSLSGRSCSKWMVPDLSTVNPSGALSSSSVIAKELVNSAALAAICGEVLGGSLGEQAFQFADRFGFPQFGVPFGLLHRPAHNARIKVAVISRS
eukprot:scaffold1118_cov249-Pinguiococcus_pyrenoidosus.AAC.4